MKKITSVLILMLAISTSIFAQSKSYCDSITSEISASISGTKVTLGVKSTGSIISQEWIFNDGSANSKDATPTHDYGRAGTFTPCVYLILKNLRDPNKPCTTKICKTITIQGSDPCADFKPQASLHLGSDGKTVTFEASASNSTSNTYTYAWDFGDNTKSDDRTGKHEYGAGTWYPCVIITSSNPKCSKKICFDPITVKGNDPCANFNPTADITVNEKGLATYKAMTGSGITYKWDFGDGTYSTTGDGTHQYAKPGTYKPCVTITYTSGTTKCTKTLCKEITIRENDPCADFNPTFSYKIGDNGLVYFTGSNTSTTYTYTWSYGDGTSGTGVQNTHTYKPGTYKVCVTIYDSKTGCKKTVCQEITIQGNNTDPCKDFNPTFNYKIDGNVVVFEGHGTTYTYKWSFGNGQYSTDRVTKFDFKKPGTYKVCVMITDPKTKCTKTICKEIVIKGRETKDPCKDFNPKVSFQTDGLKVNLEVDGGKGATMEWSFGDGTKGSTDRKVTHVYAKSGKYTICVTVYDAKRQCKKVICFTIEVQGKTQDPCADFKPDFTYTISGNKVTVEGKNISGVEYSWSWGDKLGDKGRVVYHTYKVGGKYTICMTAYDPKTKCTKTICKTISIGNGQKLVEQGKGDKEALMVYPNPATTLISVVTLSDSPAKISVKNLYGIEVIRYDATPNENKSIDMLVNELPKGTYYVYVEQDGKVETTKFVK